MEGGAWRRFTEPRTPRRRGRVVTAGSLFDPTSVRHIGGEILSSGGGGFRAVVLWKGYGMEHLAKRMCRDTVMADTHGYIYSALGLSRWDVLFGEAGQFGIVPVCVVVQGFKKKKNFQNRAVQTCPSMSGFFLQRRGGCSKPLFATKQTITPSCPY